MLCSKSLGSLNILVYKYKAASTTGSFLKASCTSHDSNCRSKTQIALYQNDSDPFTQIGISAQLPSGSWAIEDLNYDSFFDFLLDKGEAYEKIPSTRFNSDT